MYKCYINPVTRQDLKVKRERIKTLKVINEKVAQVVVENTIDINAIKIVKIDAELRDVRNHVFDDKVVMQGVIHKQVYYVDPKNDVKHIAEDIPFMTTVELPGVIPTGFTEVQNHLLKIDTSYVLTPSYYDKWGKLHQKVVADILVKVSEWTQLDVVTKVDLFPKINGSQRTHYCRK